MDIAEISNQAAVIRASREAREDIEFINSPLRKYIDNQIYKAAAKGKNNVYLGFCTIKECVLGDRYGGPTIEAAVRYYKNKGFGACDDVFTGSEDEDSIYIYWPWSQTYFSGPQKQSIDITDVIIILLIVVSGVSLFTTGMLTTDWKMLWQLL